MAKKIKERTPQIMYSESINALTSLKSVHAAQGLVHFYQEQLHSFYRLLNEQGITVWTTAGSGDEKTMVVINGKKHIFTAENEMIIFIAEHFLKQSKPEEDPEF